MVEQVSEEVSIVDEAVAEGGAYEVIRKRLVEQGNQLKQKTNTLNEARLAEFGHSDMQVKARVRVRTEHNCIARDIVQVGDYLLFGYNVFIGLKKETKVSDVFALFELKESSQEGGQDKKKNTEISPVTLKSTFLDEAGFVNDFDELYRYYKNTQLVQLVIKDGKLLAGFQIGEKIEDIRVFRWSISPDGETLKYIDNRGERDIQLPPAHDFEWHTASRDNIVNGRHPHINILDTIFVETLGGTLTIKIENNTEDGLGIFREKVEDETQSLDDAQFQYAIVGSLILLKIRPYREEQWRYFVYNKLNESILRIDAIGASCVELPENHGVIFPGGYYLESGEHKSFEQEVKGLRFKRVFRSPNGEDVLYLFYEPVEGVVCLLAYNMIAKTIQNPVYGHGYALDDDGRLVIFSAQTEPGRVHPMQIWETPYYSSEFASNMPESHSFYGRIGNAELVRGISDLFSICRIIENQSVSLKLYEELSKVSKKLSDDYYWLSDQELSDLTLSINDVINTSELVIDEFEKVEAIRVHSSKALHEAEQQQSDLIQTLHPESWETVDHFVEALAKLRLQRGHLVTIRDYRYIDAKKIDALDEELQEKEDELSNQTVDFLSDEEALKPYHKKIAIFNERVESAKTVVAIKPVIEEIENATQGLDLLSELLGTLQVEDANVRTRIIDAISQVYAKLNQIKANSRHKQKDLASGEAVAQFSAQFKLFSQSITNALGQSTTPEKCDEQLSRLLVQLEEFESQFSEYDEFLTDILTKREEIYEAFESHKQQLLDERQRKAQSVFDAAKRILASIEKRSLTFSEADPLNTYFASDALVVKVRDLIEQLRLLDSVVQADDIDARFKAIKEQGLKSLRDKTEIFEDSGNIIKLGPRHRFSVNTQELDLTIIPRDDELNIHLTGTNFYSAIKEPELNALKDYWTMTLISESDEVYRSEYLAYQILQAAKHEDDGLSVQIMQEAMLDNDKLNTITRDYANPRYKEGYEKGIHDYDAALILKDLWPALERADLLKFDPMSRAFAQLFWTNQQLFDSTTALFSIDSWKQRARSAAMMATEFLSHSATQKLVKEVRIAFTRFIECYPVQIDEFYLTRAAEYLVAELAKENPAFITSKYAVSLVEEFKRSVDKETWRQFQEALKQLSGRPDERWHLSYSWLEAMVTNKSLNALKKYVPEAAAIILCEEAISRRSTEVDVEVSVSGLLGDHATIKDRTLSFSVDEFLTRLEFHCNEVLKNYQHYLTIRQDIIHAQRESLALDSFKARPLSSFVRNRLINESYLPLIGDNLAKQMGTVGEDKRTDLMGLLMMISPPGYGKTTLMEYVASRLGLIFMKINCPALGHNVLSLDPEQSPNATARQELVKLNLALEMGNNVMLYLDDIQHTNPEFLQKFISLCDGSRRIEGVWEGKTKTYDMRGRKFCVVMAGNPYTESGEVFKIPDMLANRADIYNLGDILGGMEEQFSLSYIENSLTSNPVLAQLASREMSDVYKFVAMAKGEEVAATDLSYQYSGAEINEIVDILKKMFVIQKIVLKINQAYIASAAQEDSYRTEPPFKLQGSYRNMNKMVEKITAVMNEKELYQMIDDHYLGESQLLTAGAEANLLKLAELTGVLNEEETKRWEQIKTEFRRNQQMGGGEVGDRVVTQLVDLVNGVRALEQAAKSQPDKGLDLNSGINATIENLSGTLEKIVNNQVAISRKNEQRKPAVEEVMKTLAEVIESSLTPAIHSMEKKFDLDLRTHNKLKVMAYHLRQLRQQVDPDVILPEEPEQQDD